MQETYKDFIKRIKNKTVMFCGLGKSNIPFLKMLAKENIKTIAYDQKDIEKLNPEIINVLKTSKNISLYLGKENCEMAWNTNADIIIRTPGISFFSDKIKEAKKKGIVVTSEMEIFFSLCPCPVIGITGSDGKTTVTTIISEILKKEGKIVHVGGNIGKPLLENIEKIKKTDVAVVELSSFQLASMRQSPEIAVVTNVSPNHLDIHKDMEEYIDCKKQIFMHQNAFSKTVLNFDNDITRNFEKDVRGKIIFFSAKQELKNGVWINKNNDIIFSWNGHKEKIINTADIKIPGHHNIENYLAAISAVYGISSKEAIENTAKNFGGVEHRIEFVREINGIKFYNDSIASTPNRVMNGALSVFKGKIVLIAGGYDKKLSFKDFAETVLNKVSVLILMGNTADKIYNEITNSVNYSKSLIKIVKVKSMTDAVKEAYKNSEPGSVVLLSPACASFDMYANFEQRGNDFKKIVNSI